MMMPYGDTHVFFKFTHTPRDSTIWGSEEIDMCKQHLGQNNTTEYLWKRKWFSGPDGVYIRRDCLDNELVTWFALKAKA